MSRISVSNLGARVRQDMSYSGSLPTLLDQAITAFVDNKADPDVQQAAAIVDSDLRHQTLAQLFIDTHTRALTAADYATVLKHVSSAYKITDINDTMIRNVTMFCKKLSIPSLHEKYPSRTALLKAIADMYLEDIDPTSLPNPPNAQYEALVQAELLAAPSKSAVAKDRWGVGVGVFIDSRLRESGNSSGPFVDFRFVLSPHSPRAAFGSGRINCLHVPQNVTRIKVGRLRLPYDASLRARNFANKITLTLTALRGSGILGREDTHHFVFSISAVEGNPNVVDLVPAHKYCGFNPPISVVDDLTLRFSDPVYPITFPPDRLRPSLVNYNSADGKISFEAPHGLSTGDVVIVLGLATGNDSANKDLLDRVNDPRGVIITEIDTYTIAIGVNLSKIVNADNTSLPWVLLCNRAFCFNMEILA